MATILYLFFIQFALCTSAQAACIKSPVEFYRWDGSTTTPVLLTKDYNTLNHTGRTYFVVHGWTENGTQAQYQQIAKNYFEVDPASNIILVDYRGIAQESYLEARDIVSLAGTAMGKRIVRMLQRKSIILANIQLFGYSLGAHVCGLAAKIIKTGMNGQRVPRITATDPAGPLFRFPYGFNWGQQPLTKDDTDMLDITHTSFTMGTWEAFGHVDTYVDLLRGNQPACDGQFSADALLFCNHRLARAYFTESIRLSLSCNFQQRQAPQDLPGANSIVYGQHMPLSARGVYFMSVTATPPYAEGTQDCLAVNNR